MKRRTRSPSTAGAVIVLLLLAGCSSPSSSGDGGSPDSGAVGNDAGPVVDAGSIDAGIAVSATALQAVNTVATAICQNLVACGDVGDTATCAALLAASAAGGGLNSLQSYEVAITAGKITVNSSQIQACAQAFVDLPCGSQFNGNFNTIAACASAFVGTETAGQSCIAGSECGSGLGCFSSKSTCDGGVCGQIGVACSTDSDCSASQGCNNFTCTALDPAPGASGQACGQNNSCQSGLICFESGGINEPSVCMAPAAGGQCSVNSDCGSNSGLICTYSAPDGGMMALLCEPPAGEGQGCAPSGGVSGASPCASGLVCAPSSDLVSGTCVPPAAQGAACTTTFQCGGLLSLYICDSTTNVCVERPSSGPCMATGNAAEFGCALATSYCDMTTTTCQPVKAAGAACSSDNECSSVLTDVLCNLDAATDGGTCATGTNDVCATATETE